MSSVVNWNEIFTSNASEVADFASGTISFKNFKRAVKNQTARQEILKLEKQHSADNRRKLARRACHRRSLILS